MGGKSGAQFYVSHDQRFFIKLVSANEGMFLQNILPQYYSHVLHHPDTLVSKLLGHFELTEGGSGWSSRRQHMVIMQSVFDPRCVSQLPLSCHIPMTLHSGAG